MCVWSVNFVASLTEKERSCVPAFPICRVRKIATSLGQNEGFWFKALDTVKATGPDGETYIRVGNILNKRICVHRSILQVVFPLHVKTMPASNTPACNTVHHTMQCTATFCNTPQHKLQTSLVTTLHVATCIDV